METKVKPTVETWLCRGYLFLMLALLPLAVHNGFFDITETKTICFTVPTVVLSLRVSASRSTGKTASRAAGLRARNGRRWHSVLYALLRPPRAAILPDRSSASAGGIRVSA